MSTLVPVFSMALGAVCLGETITAWKVAAAVLVLGGLALNQWALAAAPEAQSLPAS
jgi:O-acetylserine/cysteine efflux transporter